jgi:D-lactate dehydrogenase
MKIAFFEIKDWERGYFEKELAGNELQFFPEPLKESRIPQIHDIEALVVFVYSRVNKAVLDTLPNLKLICTMSTGFDHIDLEECKARNIIVCNVAGYGEITVAEHTFALILAVSRRLIESVNRVRGGDFNPEGLTGFDLHGKKIGIIGVGAIGENVAKIAKGFGMWVLGYKRKPDSELEQRLGIKISDNLDEVLSMSDIITLHIPYSAENHHFINQEKIQKMKDGVIIINTARGGLIDSRALIEAIESQKVFGAGLDVLEEEPLLQEEAALLSHEYNREQIMSVLEDHMLCNLPNVVVTPHNAFNSREALQLIVSTTKENLINFMQNNPQNIVSAK